MVWLQSYCCRINTPLCTWERLMCTLNNAFTLRCYPWLISLKQEGKCWMLKWPSLPCAFNRNFEECNEMRHPDRACIHIECQVFKCVVTKATLWLSSKMLSRSSALTTKMFPPCQNRHRQIGNLTFHIVVNMAPFWTPFDILAFSVYYLGPLNWNILL